MAILPFLVTWWFNSAPQSKESVPSHRSRVPSHRFCPAPGVVAGGRRGSFASIQKRIPTPPGPAGDLFFVPGGDKIPAGNRLTDVLAQAESESGLGVKQTCPVPSGNKVREIRWQDLPPYDS
jgi:hypothetical protein